MAVQWQQRYAPTHSPLCPHFIIADNDGLLGGISLGSICVIHFARSLVRLFVPLVPSLGLGTHSLFVQVGVHADELMCCHCDQHTTIHDYWTRARQVADPPARVDEMGLHSIHQNQSATLVHQRLAPFLDKIKQNIWQPEIPHESRWDW